MKTLRWWSGILVAFGLLAAVSTAYRVRVARLHRFSELRPLVEDRPTAHRRLPDAIWPELVTWLEQRMDAVRKSLSSQRATTLVVVGVVLLVCVGALLLASC